MSSWLPSPPAESARPLRPWRPPRLGRRDPTGLHYVLIDEIVGAAVGLAVSEWPSVDEAGRLRFRHDPLLIGADADAFKAFLTKHRRPRGLAERPLRIGDAFAVRAIPAALEQARTQAGAQARLEPTVDPATWIKPPIYDITSDAREAAKRSFYTAVTPTLAPEQAALLREISEPPAPMRPRWPGRWPIGGGGGLPARSLVVLTGAVLFTAGIGSGTAVGRVSAPTRTIAKTTINETNEVTITQARPGATVTAAAVTVTEAGVTVTEPARTVTDAGATVTDAGATVTQTRTAAAATVTSEVTVLQTVTRTKTTVETTTMAQTVTTLAARTLRVSISGLEGRIVSKRLRIDCQKTWNRQTRQSEVSGRCRARLPTRARVDLEARPITNGLGYQFDRWLTPDLRCTQDRCVITVTTSMRIAARFVEPIG